MREGESESVGYGYPVQVKCSCALGGGDVRCGGKKDTHSSGLTPGCSTVITQDLQAQEQDKLLMAFDG